MDRKIFTCSLMGGLGNQMFQIANAFSKSLENNANLVLRKNSNTSLQGNNTSYYINNIYKKLNFSDILNPEIKITEKDWSFSEIEVPKNKSVEFFGYYQSSKNFKKHKNEIIELFSPDENFKSLISKKYKEINLKNTVSIHIRRGDYMNYRDIHPVISKSYIEECLNRIYEIDHIFIFTDDKKWAIENLKINNSTIVSEEDWEELWIMSMCKINIMSNSTFSWWSSFLNTNKDKKVFCPSIWFGNGGPKNYESIFETEFNIIDCKLINNEIVYEKN